MLESGDVPVHTLARMNLTNRLRIGYLHYPPFSLDSEGGPSGFYVDLIRTLCESIGVAPEFRLVRFSSAIRSVLDDKVDLVLCIFQTPRRSRVVDFAGFLHSVSVSGVVRYSERRVSSQSDLVSSKLKFVVCRDEIGHEILVDQLRIPEKQMLIVDTNNVSDIIDLVASGKADIAIADSLSCEIGLAARNQQKPKLRPVLRRLPLSMCPNGVMIPREQPDFSEWIDTGLKKIRQQGDFPQREVQLLSDLEGIVIKM